MQRFCMVYAQKLKEDSAHFQTDLVSTITESKLLQTPETGTENKQKNIFFPLADSKWLCS